MRQRVPYALVFSGLLIAMSIVLSRVFSASVPIAGVPASRLSVGFVPIMLAGILIGPWWGAAVGVLADVIGFFLFPSGPFFPPITLTSALVGVLPGLVFRFMPKAADWLKAALAVAAVQVFCSMLLQTYWLTILLSTPFDVLFALRAPVALVLIPVFFVLIYSLLAGMKKAKLLPKQPA